MKPIDIFTQTVKGKKVAVVGVGISNMPLISMLCNAGAFVTAYDKSDAKKETLSEMGITLHSGNDYLKDLNADIIFKTPGIRYDVPEIQNAVKEGAVLTSEIEMFFSLCPAKIFAVTGSDGKTTTTTLIYKMLKEEYENVYLGGNIGKPLLPEIEKIGASDFVVAELSSFQLMTMKKSPSVAVITNITPNHLDVHKSYDEYIDAKRNIYLHQKETDTLVVNYDNDVTRKIATLAKSSVRGFSATQKTECGMYLGAGDNIIYKNGRTRDIVMNASDIKIPGRHNIENYMAACLAVYDYVSIDTMKKVAHTFGGVQHRLEFVREKDGVSFYNSSIDSSPKRTIAALSTFNKKIILIAGGKDKGIPYDEIGPHIADKVKLLILTGPTAEPIHNSLKKTGREKECKVIKVNNYKEAVTLAYENAQSGDTVLLSPASTSFDMFRNFEERGNVYKDIVNSL